MTWDSQFLTSTKFAELSARIQRGEKIPVEESDWMVMEIIDLVGAGAGSLPAVVSIIFTMARTGAPIVAADLIRCTRRIQEFETASCPQNRTMGREI